MVEEEPRVPMRSRAVRELHAADQDVPVRVGDDLDPELEPEILAGQRQVRDRSVAAFSETGLKSLLHPVDRALDRDRDARGTAKDLMFGGNERSVELAKRSETVARREKGTVSCENGARQRVPPDLPTDPSRRRVARYQTRARTVNKPGLVPAR